jgi:hypothetical protein
MMATKLARASALIALVARLPETSSVLILSMMVGFTACQSRKLQRPQTGREVRRQY